MIPPKTDVYYMRGNLTPLVIIWDEPELPKAPPNSPEVKEKEPKSTVVDNLQKSNTQEDKEK